VIAFIRGILNDVKGDSITVDVNGVGLEVFIHQRTYHELPQPGQVVKIHTHWQALDSEFKLYGFMSEEERNLFRTLLGVSGIGARGALGLLGSWPPGKLINAIVSGDEKMLVKAPGIGSKTAQRIIFELKGKLTADLAITANAEHNNMAELMEALEALGYHRSEVYPLIIKLQDEGQLPGKLQEALKVVLRAKAIV